MHDSEVRFELSEPRGWQAAIDLKRNRNVRLIGPNNQLAARSPIEDVVETGCVQSLITPDQLVPLPESVISEIVHIEQISEYSDNL